MLKSINHFRQHANSLYNQTSTGSRELGSQTEGPVTQKALSTVIDNVHGTAYSELSANIADNETHPIQQETGNADANGSDNIRNWHRRNQVLVRWQ